MAAKKFRVDLRETASYKDRWNTENADGWYVDASGALVFTRGGLPALAYGPREWARVSEAKDE